MQIRKIKSTNGQRFESNSFEPPDEKTLDLHNMVPSVKPRRPKKASLVTNVSPVPAYRQQLFDSFMRSWLPLDELDPREDNAMRQLAQLPNQTPALTTATLAVSLSRIGTVNGDECLAKESLKHYTEGLKELQKALYDPVQMHSDETLAACLLLGIFELLNCPGDSKEAYAIHTKGCARLLEARGPKAHRKGLGHSLFLAIRPQCVRSFYVLFVIRD